MRIFPQLLNRIGELIRNGNTDQSLGVRYGVDKEPVCYYCGRPLVDWNQEHVAARSIGGVDDQWNLVIACPECNQKKKAKTPTRWFLEEMEMFSTLPDEIAIDLLARLLLNLHLFMSSRITIGVPVMLGINEAGNTPLFAGDYQREVTVPIGSSGIHPDFECRVCHLACNVDSSLGSYILRVTCEQCKEIRIYQGSPLA